MDSGKVLSPKILSYRPAEDVIDIHAPMGDESFVEDTVSHH